MRFVARRDGLPVPDPMKRSLALFGLLLLLTGCLPLRQSVQVAGPEHPSLLLCDNRYLRSVLPAPFVSI